MWIWLGPNVYKWVRNISSQVPTYIHVGDGAQTMSRSWCDMGQNQTILWLIQQHAHRSHMTCQWLSDSQMRRRGLWIAETTELTDKAELAEMPHTEDRTTMYQRLNDPRGRPLTCITSRLWHSLCTVTYMYICRYLWGYIPHSFIHTGSQPYPCPLTVCPSVVATCLYT